MLGCSPAVCVLVFWSVPADAWVCFFYPHISLTRGCRSSASSSVSLPGMGPHLKTSREGVIKPIQTFAFAWFRESGVKNEQHASITHRIHGGASRAAVKQLG